MKKECVVPNNVLEHLEIEKDSILRASFQGEMSTVFFAKSSVYGDVVVKVVDDSALRETELTEVDENIAGYRLIPDKFKPKVFYVSEDNKILVLENAGKPLRDWLWQLSGDDSKSTEAVGCFLTNLNLLLQETRGLSKIDGRMYLEKIEANTIFFLDRLSLSKERVEILDLIERVKKLNLDTVAYASGDGTQGNYLVDLDNSRFTLKIVDPKTPRVIDGLSSVLGFPEIDLGMFLITLKLNSPQWIENGEFEKGLREIIHGFRGNKEVSDILFDIGRMYGCILVATFPNSVDSVRSYVSYFGIDFDERMKKNVLNEKERHLSELRQTLSKYFIND